MASLGTTPTGSDGIPLSSALVPGTVNLIPVSGTTLLTDANGNQYTLIAVEDLEQAGYIALTSSSPSATTAGTDTAFTFTSQVNRVVLHNKTTATVYYAFDAAASLGSLSLVPGAMLIYPKRVSVVHLYTVAAQAVNGSSDGNVVLLGAL